MQRFPTLIFSLFVAIMFFVNPASTAESLGAFSGQRMALKATNRYGGASYTLYLTFKEGDDVSLITGSGQSLGPVMSTTYRNGVLTMEIDQRDSARRVITMKIDLTKNTGEVGEVTGPQRDHRQGGWFVDKLTVISIHKP